MSYVPTLKALVKKLETHTRARGNPKEVLAILDTLVQENGGMMNIGPEKGNIIKEILRKNPPKTMIELGCFFGYSAVMFAGELQKVDGAKYTSFELSEDFAAISRRVVDFAGLSNKVDIVVGPASKTLPEFWERLKRQVDFAFIDHEKRAYVPDLQIMESLGLVAPGTILVADNVIRPGAPEYIKYVEASTDERKKLLNVGSQYPGKWNLLYDSNQIKVLLGFGVDALEVSKCVGVAEE